MRGAALALAVLAAVAQPVFAQAPVEVRAAAPSAVAVTIYRDDLALITETRDVDMPGGLARIVFEGVLDRVIPQSAVVRGLDAERERNFDFDGLNARSLLFRSIGQKVEIVRTAPGTGRETVETATIAAAGDGIVLQFADRAEALGCAGLPERLRFERVPETLRAEPALSTVADAPAGRRQITLSYLATGVTWSTNYVLTMGADGAPSDLAAWITLRNRGEEGFADATVGVVAGDLARVFTPATRRSYRETARRACWPLGTTSDAPAPPIPHPMAPPPPPPPPPMAMAAPAMDERIVVTGARAKQADREELGDYQLYRFPDRTGVAAKQTKQVMLLHKQAVQMERVLRYVSWPNQGSHDPLATSVALRARNETETGLGEPLPEGRVRVFASAGDAGVLLTGDARVRDTAVGLEWEVETGPSPSVQVEKTVLTQAQRRLSRTRVRVTQTLHFRVTNALATPQSVEIAQSYWNATPKISGESSKHVLRNGLPTWRLVVPANGETVLSYTLRYDQ
jgi:hypothetical protein